MSGTGKEKSLFGGSQGRTKDSNEMKRMIKEAYRQKIEPNQSFPPACPSYVKNTTHMLRTFQQRNHHYGPFMDGVRLVIIDVIELYTKILHQDVLPELRFHVNSMPQTNIPPTERVADIANHVLSSNVFSLEDDYFQQFFDTATGTPMAPSVPNLFMGWLEAQLRASSPVPVSQDTWKRFIDDIFLLWTGTPQDLDVFFEHINSFHPTIKFTIASCTYQLPFLDILISLKDGFLKTDIHAKTTDSHAYLPNSSCHLLHVVNNIPYSQFLSLRRHCADTEVFNARCDELEGRFLRRDYHLKNVQDARARASNTPRSETLQYKPELNTNRTPFIVTHHPSKQSTNRTSFIVTHHPSNQNTNRTSFIVTHHPSNQNTNRTSFIVTHHPSNQNTNRTPFDVTHHPSNPPLRSWFTELQPSVLHTIRRMQQASPTLPFLGSATASRCDHYSHTVLLPTPPDTDPGCFRCDKRPCIICTSHLVETSTFNSSTTKESFQIRHLLTCQSYNIMYLLYCDTCQQSQYVGETKNTLKTRFYQHRSNINKNTGTKHFNQTDHSIHNMKCVAVEKVHSDKREDRLRREAFWIQKQQDPGFVWLERTR